MMTVCTFLSLKRLYSHCLIVTLLLLSTYLISFTHSFQSPSRVIISNSQLSSSFRGFAPSIKDFSYSGRIKPGKLSPTRYVPDSILQPHYGKGNNRVLDTPREINQVIPMSSEDIAKMRIAGKYAREVLDIAIQSAKPGMTTDDIDAIVHDETIKRNCYPSPLHYKGFPKSCCVSINEVMCHGIPDTGIVLQDGDTMNIDVTLFYDGVHGDCSESILIGNNVPEEAKEMIYTTYLAWDTAIKACKPGMKFQQIGGIIEDIVRPKGYSIVKAFVGHGIGRGFHTFPSIFHYRNPYNQGEMIPGATFTIEPIVCQGKEDYLKWPDKWTITTKDGKRCAQFEHTLLITETGVDVLTQKLPTSPKYFWEK